MIFYAFQAILSITCVSLVVGTSEFNSDKCGCNLLCDIKYQNADKPNLELRDACRKGCRIFHPFLQFTSKNNPKQCIISCSHVTRGNTALEGACITGCQNGCRIRLNQKPSIKLTILVEEEVSENELEQVLTDPALRQLTHRRTTSDAKIPSSSFTNLPVSRDGFEPRLCASWLAGEPAACAALFVLAGVILLAAYWRHLPVTSSSPSSPTDEDEVPLIPEKESLQLSV